MAPGPPRKAEMSESQNHRSISNSHAVQDVVRAGHGEKQLTSSQSPSIVASPGTKARVKGRNDTESPREAPRESNLRIQTQSTKSRDRSDSVSTRELEREERDL